MGSITFQFTVEADRAAFVDLLAEAIGKALSARQVPCLQQPPQERLVVQDGAALPATDSKLVNVEEAAEMLGVSSRMVRRLRDISSMPRPISLGSLIRWHRDEVDQWITDGGSRVDRRGAGRR